ncbi:MAG: hypothetical protein HY905_02190 [Deltaproteobacteria bacterium]|nr:hypothetical protein [Deltaproteobacteria bacterium]
MESSPPDPRPLVRPPVRPSARRRRLALVAILGALVLLVYLPGLGGGFIYDDHYLIETNAYVRDPARLGEALTSDLWHGSTGGDLGGTLNRYYRPVVTLAYALEFRAFGEDPVGYHVVGLALHLAAVLLAFSWMWRRLARWGDAGLLGAALGAALFALHPSRPESVSWISGSTDLWMAFFALLGLAAWDRLRGAARIALTSLAFLLAIASKEAALPLPLLLAADAWLLPGGASERRARLRDAGAVAALLFAAFAVRMLAVPLDVGGGGTAPEGAGRAVLRVLASLGGYLGRIVWPWPPSVAPQCVTYGTDGLPQYDSAAVAVGAVGCAGAAVLVALAWRTPRLRPWLGDAAWLLVLLLPASNLVPLRLETLVADRNLYLPLLGAAALVGRAVAVTATRGAVVRNGALLAGGLAVAACGALALLHVPHLRSDAALWEWESRAFPGSLCALRPLTEVRLREGRYAEALALARDVLQFSRDRPGDGGALLAAGALLHASPDADQDVLLALRRFYDALARGESPTLAAAGFRVKVANSSALLAGMRRNVPGFRVARALAHARTGDLAGAEVLLRATVEDSPRSPAAWSWLARVVAWQQRWTDAEGILVEAGRHGVVGGWVPALRDGLRVGFQASSVAGDSRTRALALADAFLGLDAPGLARGVLQPEFARGPVDPELVGMMVVVEAFDGQYDSARGVLAAARRHDPARAAQWDAALRDLDQAERLYGDRRRVSVAP